MSTASTGWPSCVRKSAFTVPSRACASCSTVSVENGTSSASARAQLAPARSSSRRSPPRRAPPTPRPGGAGRPARRRAPARAASCPSGHGSARLRGNAVDSSHDRPALGHRDEAHAAACARRWRAPRSATTRSARTRPSSSSSGASPSCSARRTRSTCRRRPWPTRSRCRILTEPGDELLAEENAHILLSEQGGPAVHSGLVTRPIRADAGRFDGDDVRALMRRPNVDAHGAHEPRRDREHAQLVRRALLADRRDRRRRRRRRASSI